MSTKEKLGLEKRIGLVIAMDRNRAEAVSETSFGELCNRAEISRQAGYRWLERWRQEGLDAFADSSRRRVHHRRQHDPRRQRIGPSQLRDRRPPALPDS